MYPRNICVFLCANKLRTDCFYTRLCKTLRIVTMYVCYTGVKFRPTHGNILVTIFLTKCMYKTVEEDDLWLQQNVKSKSTSSKQSMICQLEKVTYTSTMTKYLDVSLLV